MLPLALSKSLKNITFESTRNGKLALAFSTVNYLCKYCMQELSYRKFIDEIH